MLLPDFLLIVGGFFLCRFTSFERPAWDVVERLVYHLLFPALLFASIVKSPLRPTDAAAMAGAGVALIAILIALCVPLCNAGTLPTASSAYVLAVRMGGNGPFVAGLITLSTLLGMVTVPLWVGALRWLRP